MQLHIDAFVYLMLTSNLWGFLVNSTINPMIDEVIQK